MPRRAIVVAAIALAVAVLVAGVLVVRSLFGDEDAAVIDERAGSYRDVRLGAGADDVRRAFGEPGGGRGIAPLGEKLADIGGPPFIPGPPGGGRPLRYDGVTFLVGPDGVYGFVVTEADAETRRGIAIGSLLDTARVVYGLACTEAAPGGLGATARTYRFCTGTLANGLQIWFGEDPIRSIALARTPD